MNALLPRRSFLALPFLIAACATKTAEPTTLNIWVEADEIINLNELGESSPVVLRIYELKSVSIFEQAAFFDLFDSDTARLGQEMVGRRELELRPGDRQRLLRKVSNDVRYVGVMVGFREIGKSEWRGMVEIVSGFANNLTINISALSVKIDRLSVKKSWKLSDR